MTERGGPVTVCPISGTPVPPPRTEPDPATPPEPTGAGTAVAAGGELPEGHADLAEAEDFLEQARRHGRWPDQRYAARLEEVRREIARTGTYEHTLDELTIGAKIAWYNHTRCIGKLFWRSLRLRDCRHLESAEEIADDLFVHLERGGNGGDIKPVLSVYPPSRPGRPGPRIRNSSLIRYAGYRRPDGTILGDPANADVTDLARSLGWMPEHPTRFDVLPLIIDTAGHPMLVRDIPAPLAMEVPMEHPTIPGIAELGLRWYGFPTISDMEMRIGGVTYPAAPFTGWYLVTEIAARNYGDQERYDLLPAVAEVLGLDTGSHRTLWKDRALLELTAAVLHSFERAGVRMVDHHTAADQFHRFQQVERRAERTVNAEWSWIVPPMSPSTMPVYHQQYPDDVVLPNFLRPGGQAFGQVSGTPACPVTGQQA
ncbi:MAG TPA: nitric oxide synthase oxygenase [Pseudonocardiaceae bacterium]